MNPLRIWTPALFGAALLLTAPARGQDAPPPGSPASLLDALALLSGGILPMPGVSPEVTQENGRSHVAIPLHGLALPPDAAITVTATADTAGVWDITGATVPESGTIRSSGKPPGTLRYTIGQQAAHARIDPTLRLPSPYALAFSDIAVHQAGASPGELTIDQFTEAGTLTGSDGGRVTAANQGTIENMVLSGTGRDGGTTTVAVRALGVRYDVRDMDLARAKRLGEVTRAIAAEPPPPSSVNGPRQPRDMRKMLRAYVEAAPGMMSGLDTEVTLKGLHIRADDGSTGDIGEMRIGMAGDATGDSVGGSIDLGADAMAFPSAPPAYAAYVPSKIVMRTVFAGIPAERLRHWLLDTTEQNADPAALRAEAMALLGQPGARAGIEALQVNAGPVRVEGSADMRPQPDGSAAYDVHLTAQGMDALLAQVQSDPNAKQILPMLFLAKGFGRQVGDHLVWDIHFAHGMVTVNGVSLPLGPPNAKKPR